MDEIRATPFEIPGGSSTKRKFKKCRRDVCETKGRTINDFGGGEARAKVGKKINGYSPGKKSQLNNPEKLISLLAREKKPHQLVGQEKKLNTNSLPEAPPDH